MSKDSVGQTFLVATLLCVVCSVVVSTAAVQLRPIQEKNAALDMKRNILGAAGLADEKGSIAEVFAEFIEAKVVDLKTGEYVDHIDPTTFNQRKAAKDPELSKEIENDLAGIGRRSRYIPIFLVKRDGEMNRLILPVHGKGLWSTLYGFLALDTDLNTIKALSFYQHAETPGLGGEVDNPKWKAQWEGKKAYGPEGEAKIEVLKGKVDPLSPYADYQVDGISGATITSRGVSNLVRYWLGDDGYGKFIEKLERQGV